MKLHTHASVQLLYTHVYTHDAVCIKQVTDVSDCSVDNSAPFPPRQSSMSAPCPGDV